MYSYNPYDSYYSNNSIEDIFNSFFSNGGAAFFGIFMTFFFIIIAIALVLSVVMYIFSALPLYKLAKKLNRPYAWLAWIPVAGIYFRSYVLCDLAGDKELVIIKDKIVIKNRTTSFLIYLGIVIFGTAIITTIASILMLIPIIGWLSFILLYIPVVCAGFMDYAYLRDALDIFKEDKQSNNTTAIVVTLLDCLVTMGIARIVVLFTLLKHEPLPQNVVNCESAPVYETPVYAQPSYTAPAEAPVVQTPIAETTPANADNNIEQ